MPRNRRHFPRFSTPAMYTPVGVRVMESASFHLEGHAYDISEGGVRFELDQAVPPGTRIAMQITLPEGGAVVGPGRSVFVFATVVWLEDEEEPGPVRMAAVFTHFARVGDRERLLRQFASGRFRLAA